MRNFNLIPKEGNPTESRVQLYYLQQIAKSLETIVQQNTKNERTYELLTEERNKHEITNAALQLMIQKDEICNLFNGKEVITLEVN